MPAAPEIRPLVSIDEYSAAEQLQREVWGFVDVEVVPLHVLLTAAKNGGAALGAFDGDALVGFAFGFLGRDELGVKHCSHMLGVAPGARRRGIGEALKWAQREHVLDGGVERMTWTYDPLLAPNARLNLHRLGAVCRRFRPNVYGELRDDLNRGLPTDRFEVDWWLESPSVTSRADGAPLPAAVTDADVGTLPAVLDSEDAGGVRAPVLPPSGRESQDAPKVRAEIPADLSAVKRHDPTLARAWVEASRGVFPALFARGYAATDLLRTSGRAFYVLERAAPA